MCVSTVLPCSQVPASLFAVHCGNIIYKLISWLDLASPLLYHLYFFFLKSSCSELHKSHVTKTQGHRYMLGASGKERRHVGRCLSSEELYHLLQEWTKHWGSLKPVSLERYINAEHNVLICTVGLKSPRSAMVFSQISLLCKESGMSTIGDHYSANHRCQIQKLVERKWSSFYTPAFLPAIGKHLLGNSYKARSHFHHLVTPVWAGWFHKFVLPHHPASLE